MRSAAFLDGISVMAWEVIAGASLVVMALVFLPRWLEVERQLTGAEIGAVLSLAQLARIITGQQVSTAIIDYYLHQLPDVTVSNARKRLPQLALCGRLTLLLVTAGRAQAGRGTYIRRPPDARQSRKL